MMALVVGDESQKRKPGGKSITWQSGANVKSPCRIWVMMPYLQASSPDMTVSRIRLEYFVEIIT